MSTSGRFVKNLVLTENRKILEKALDFYNDNVTNFGGLSDDENTCLKSMILKCNMDEYRIENRNIDNYADFEENEIHSDLKNRFKYLYRIHELEPEVLNKYYCKNEMPELKHEFDKIEGFYKYQGVKISFDSSEAFIIDSINNIIRSDSTYGDFIEYYLMEINNNNLLRESISQQTIKISLKEIENSIPYLTCFETKNLGITFKKRDITQESKEEIIDAMTKSIHVSGNKSGSEYIVYLLKWFINLLIVPIVMMVLLFVSTKLTEFIEWKYDERSNIMNIILPMLSLPTFAVAFLFRELIEKLNREPAEIAIYGIIAIIMIIASGASYELLGVSFSTWERERNKEYLLFIRQFFAHSPRDIAKYLRKAIFSLTKNIFVRKMTIFIDAFLISTLILVNTDNPNKLSHVIKSFAFTIFMLNKYSIIEQGFFLLTVLSIILVFTSSLRIVIDFVWRED
jgi:hypothetical protein